MMGLPNFDELQKQAAQFMDAIKAQIAELRGLREDIGAVQRELSQLRGEVQIMRGQIQRIEVWQTTITQNAA